jgi:hypothetical protein
LNRPVIFNLHGIDPLETTILKQHGTGDWIRGGTLALPLDQFNCSRLGCDVRYFESTRINWLRAAEQRPCELRATAY